MCKGIGLDKSQQEALQKCIEETQQPRRSRFARFKTGLTMVLIGMHASSNRTPFEFDEKNPLF
jgi:hypothetical protein